VKDAGISRVMGRIIIRSAFPSSREQQQARTLLEGLLHRSTHIIDEQLLRCIDDKRWTDFPPVLAGSNAP